MYQLIAKCFFINSKEVRYENYEKYYKDNNKTLQNVHKVF